MGHASDKYGVLKELRARLDCNPIGLPEDLNIYEILALLFTNEEASIAAKFPLEPVSMQELEECIKIPGERLSSILESMLDKGLVLESKKGGLSRYMLSMALVGFFEFVFMRTNGILPLDILARLINEYRLGPAFTKELFNANTPRARSLLYENLTLENKTEVLTFEYASHLIKEAGRGGLTNCYCRHEAYHLDQACGYPIHDFCISLGTASDFLIERGFARRASVEEILDKLTAAKKLGLMHVCDNVKHQVAFICNCCGCCCCFLAGITKHKLSYSVATTNYIAAIDTTNCTGCGECSKKCQIKAIKEVSQGEHGYVQVDQTFCLGCGICASFCQQKAIQMGERGKRIIPPGNIGELMRRLKQDRGKSNIISNNRSLLLKSTTESG